MRELALYQQRSLQPKPREECSSGTSMTYALRTEVFLKTWFGLESHGANCMVDLGLKVKQ